MPEILPRRHAYNWNFRYGERARLFALDHNRKTAIQLYREFRKYWITGTAGATGRFEGRRWKR